MIRDEIKHKLIVGNHKNKAIANNHMIIRYNMQQDKFEILALEPLYIND